MVEPFEYEYSPHDSYESVAEDIKPWTLYRLAQFQMAANTVGFLAVRT